MLVPLQPTAPAPQPGFHLFLNALASQPSILAPSIGPTWGAASTWVIVATTDAMANAMVFISAPPMTATEASAPSPILAACPRRAAPKQRWRRRSACRPPGRAAARAARAAPGATAAASRNAPARPGDRRRARYGGRAAPRRRARWRE